MNKSHLDFETRSRADLKKVGAWAYALHPSTNVVCLTFGYSKDRLYSIGAWHIGWDWTWAKVKSRLPADLVADLEAGTAFIIAHNAAFEYALYNIVLHKRFGWPALWNPANWGCTLARAAMCGLPLGLDDLGGVLETKVIKDRDGQRLMHQLCKPTIEVPGQVELAFDENPAKLERFLQYNRTDVLVEMEADALLPEMPESERKIWELDLIINRRGIKVDLAFAERAALIADALVKPLNAELKRLTGGIVSAATEVVGLKAWIKTQGVELPTKTEVDHETGEEIDKETLDKVGIVELLNTPGIPSHVRRAVEIRAQVSKKTSTAKYAKARAMVGPDHRVRGTLQYHGAHTGRWAGRLLQTHNIPKGYKEKEQAVIVDHVMTGDPDLFDMVTGGRGMTALSDALRGLIIAAAGKVLVCADFNAIEARVVFWLAGCLGPLAAYARGESPYLEMARLIFPNDGLPNSVDEAKKTHPFQYDIGKRSILGDGFGMGWKKFQSNTYLETAKMGKPVWLSDELSKRAVDGYRSLYSEVPRLWKDVEAAAVSAVREPGKRFTCAGGRVLWSMSNDRRFLVCRLPSGRYLWYWKPSIKLTKTRWGDMRASLHYWGEHPKIHQWMNLSTYGGKLTENIVQAIARDLMAGGMLAVEGAGFEDLLTVHDEVLSEIKWPHPNYPDQEQMLEHFENLMCDLPPWAAGLPVATEGWVSTRYHK